MPIYLRFLLFSTKFSKMLIVYELVMRHITRKSEFETYLTNNLTIRNEIVIAFICYNHSLNYY